MESKLKGEAKNKAPLGEHIKALETRVMRIQALSCGL